jgi:hypothetical protein
MNASSYALANATIVSAIVFAPWLDDLLKIYLIIALVLVAFTVNIALHIGRIRDLIVGQIIQTIIKEVMTDKSVQEIFRMKFEAMAKQIREEEKEHDTHQE